MEAENYWIYQTTVTLFDGTEQVSELLDSVWIDRIVELRGNNYWVWQNQWNTGMLMRDSADCVIMGSEFIEQVIYTTNQDTLLSIPPIYKVMTQIGERVTVPAGEFEASNCVTLLRKTGAGEHSSEYPSFDKKFFVGEQFICSPEIGLIKHVSYYLGSMTEVELIRYKVKGVNL